MTQGANVEWLFARQRFGVHPGLERVRELLARLGTPQRNFEVVLVGGTNGKGSTAASLEAMLRAGGRRTGLFTSPHLTRLSERFVVGGAELPQGVVAAALDRVRPASEAVEASFFEVITALGCLLFAEAEVDLAVMEVGLGGRLDATNVLDPRLSVITNVALDHTAILGDTPGQIAAEKAGILRAGQSAVTAVAPDVLPILERQGADLWALGRDWAAQTRSLGWDGTEVGVQWPGGGTQLRTPLLGEHGGLNAALAAVAAARLGVPTPAIVQGAAQTRWPGRLEVLSRRGLPRRGLTGQGLTGQGGNRVLLDGAHNPAGARALAQALRPLLAGQGQERLPVIFGAAEDKDLAGVAAELLPLASRVILTRAALSPRAADPARLAALFPGVPLEQTETPAQALAALRPEEDLALACGSLYLLGELRPLLLGEQPESHERWQ
ncbi:bifunctional folylpolyglutamate synthase/dihydrofolate synthase [Deinococcus wulumuqiensis]|uniref:bifunctional folylpolyglutamate synthase/dihydrofolate synthase n=1 Tax=Deinococcus wulumuqiensis TaxID=980427 RepID=UPI00242CD663|nr:folylpolyglutamate synthase/dihydrofolate synthase family protein [Deinococcus wulumuqiensis]